MKWKSLIVDERYEQLTRPYYFQKDDENQIAEPANVEEALAIQERNMDGVADYAQEKAELDEPPKDLVKHFLKMEKREKNFREKGWSEV